VAGSLEIAVVGAGWAGLAAAVEASRRRARVTLFEMSAGPGGRARSVDSRGTLLDNGQHICIGAYSETLRLMHDLGVVEGDAFLRQPLTLVDAHGAGLRLRRGPVVPTFVAAVLGRRGWRWRERLALLCVAARWRHQGFRCPPERTVADLAAELPAPVRTGFIEPLCVAALNTPAEMASGTVFLRVLRDALGGGPGSADLLLPRLSLDELFPAPAIAWLARAGATVRLGHRVDGLERRHGRWSVDGTPADRVVVAASASEAARLVGPHADAWAAQASALEYQPIVTVYARSAGCRLPAAMLALEAGADRPAQFVFDRGRLGGPEGLLAFVVSGARDWVHKGLAETERATLAQATLALVDHLGSPLEPVRTLVEKRATFACTPGLQRPPLRAASGLLVCGDYVEGPYPATLEGAVRSGLAAARAASA
jgi:squalene-associated FAD-dependent desaturase